MRLLDFILKEFRQMRRDRRLMMMMIGMPTLQLLLYGYAVTTDIRHIQVVVCDQDNSYASRTLRNAVTASPDYFDVVGYVSTQAEAQSYLDSGRAAMALVIPPTFSRDLAKGQPAQVQALLDGSDPNAGTVAASYIAKIVTAQATSILQQRAEAAGLGDLTQAGVDGRVQIWYNPTLQSNFAMVPGVLCLIVGNLTIILTALAIVREREIGTIEQLLVTPMRSWELMLGKLIPYLLVGFTDVLVILVLSGLLFGVPNHGSVMLLFGISGVFMVGTLGLGLLISTMAQNQQQAMQLASFLLMPNMLLSGFVYPIANMPNWLQPVTYFLPMRYFLICVRGLMMKGNGTLELTSQIWPMALLSAAIFAAAVLRFRKRLD